MGGGVSGGTRTQLAGTYLAEQTHYQPPKYTLISVSSALGPDGCPKHLPSSATAGGAPGATPRLRQGGPAPVTVIPALADMEPLLQDNERRAQERCQENEEQAGPAEENLGVEADAPSARRYKARDREAPTEAFARLCCGHRPWVASRTDAELYAYLAQRSNDPGMAELAELAESPSPKAQETPRSVKQRHTTHTELFDSVLRQDQSRPQSVSSSRAVFWSSLPSSPKSPSSRRRRADLPKSREGVSDRLYRDYLRRKERAEARLLLAGVPWDQSKMDEMSSCATPSTSASSRFLELIEDLSVKDIPVLPEDPVEAFLQRRPKRDDGQRDLIRRTSTLFDKERAKRDRPPKVTL